MTNERPRLNTEGRELLIDYRAIAGKSQAWVAEQVGVHQSSVSCWETGDTRPEPHHRLILAGLAGIQPDAWLTAEERRSVAEAHARIQASRGEAA